MINLKYIKNQKLNGVKLVEVLFYSFPLWFIVGNLAVSINTLLFIIASLLLIKRKQLSFRFNNSYWFLIAFFLYFFISTTVQFSRPGFLNETLQGWINQDGFWAFEKNPIVKTIFQIRFLVLIFVVDTLFFNKILDLKKLFLSSLICTSFVCFDIILQYISGFDLLGYEGQGSWNSGPFGDEWIAGGYLKNFSLFSFFYIFASYKNKNFNIPLLIFVIALHLVATLLSGNKMPLLLFLFGCVLTILLTKNLRFAMSLGLLLFMSIFFLIYSKDSHYHDRYKAFFGEINIIKLIEFDKATEKINENNEDLKSTEPSIFSIPKEVILLRGSEYNRIFRTALLMWQEQPLFGFGLKSFRIKCWDMLAKDNAKRKVVAKHQYIVCANHAHNYYLEFLSEAGIIGASLIIIFFLILLKKSFNFLKKYKKQKNPGINLLIPVIILFFLEIWPAKSSGSFFTTWGATFFWLNTGLLISGVSKKNNLT